MIKGMNKNKLGKIREINEKHIGETEKEYHNFRENFSKNVCYMCNSSLDSFDEKNPCLHWLLRPNGFKKRHFKSIYNKFDYFQIDSYLRWVANTEILFKNINDLSEEKSESKIIETTIKFRNFEWSFSCSKTDLQGHNTRHGNFPHYHFQMRIDGRQFINYSDFHIPFKPRDLYMLDVKMGKIKDAQYIEGYGSGMETIFNSEFGPELLKHMKSTTDKSKETVHISNIIEAEPGKKISSDDVFKLLEESKRTSIPLANLLYKLDDAKTTSIITPSNAVPDIAKRSSRNKKK